MKAGSYRCWHVPSGATTHRAADGGGPGSVEPACVRAGEKGGGQGERRRQGNAFNQIYTYHRIRQTLKGETQRIVPGHDPVLWDRHPTWTVREVNQVAELNLAEGDASRRPKRMG